MNRSILHNASCNMDRYTHTPSPPCRPLLPYMRMRRPAEAKPRLQYKSRRTDSLSHSASSYRLVLKTRYVICIHSIVDSIVHRQSSLSSGRISVSLRATNKDCAVSALQTLLRCCLCRRHRTVTVSTDCRRKRSDQETEALRLLFIRTRGEYSCRN